MSRPTTKGFFVKERLTEARDARGLSQNDVSRLVERSASTISKWESGEQAPEPNALELLADKLRVSTAYFLKAMPDQDDASIFFRSLASTTGRARIRARGRVRWLQHISLALQEIVDFPSVNLPDFGNVDYSQLRDGHLEEIATELRSFWKLGDGPIPSMALVAENAGIVVGIDSAGSTKIDGQSAWLSTDNRPYILLNNDKYTSFRRQMDIAHELSHIVLHKSVTPEGFERDFSLIENQAKYLACAILLPYKTFVSDIFSLSLDGLLNIKPRWMVSVGAMVKRAHQLDLISDEAATRLWKARASRGWHKREPLDDPSETPVESPRLLQRSVELIVDERVRSKRELVEIDIGLDGGDIALLCSLPTDYFVEWGGNVVALQPQLKAAYGESRESGTIVPFYRTT